MIATRSNRQSQQSLDDDDDDDSDFQNKAFLLFFPIFILFIQNSSPKYSQEERRNMTDSHKAPYIHLCIDPGPEGGNKEQGSELPPYKT